MAADLQLLEEWIPERMDPGTIFVLEKQSRPEAEKDPIVAVLACPRCGTMGLITRRQFRFGGMMICGSDSCSAEFQLDGDQIHYRRMQ